MMSMLDPWGFVPLLMIFAASFSIPYLYLRLGDRRGFCSLALQGLVFLAFSLMIALVLGLFWYSFPPFPDPLLFLVLSRFLFPLLVIALAGVNWYKLFIDSSPSYSAVTLAGLGASMTVLGALYVLYLPLLSGQPASSILSCSVPVVAVGLVLMAGAIYLWARWEKITERISASA